jgi:hypothetical protein
VTDSTEEATDALDSMPVASGPVSDEIDEDGSQHGI